MKTQISRLVALASLFAGLGLSTSAHAVWTFDSGNYTSSSPTTGTGVAGDPKVTLSGFNVANGTNNAGFSGTGNWAATTTTDNAANTINGLASQGTWGVGMYTGTDNGSPYHAIDNNGRTEGVLLSFDTSVVLKSIGLGYVSNNTYSGSTLLENCQNASCNNTTGNIQVDLSVFRWVGNSTTAGNVAPTLGGTAAGSMSGWELVGNYGDMMADNTNPYNLVNGSNKGSSWWLITAYNSGYAQYTSTETRGSLDNGNDYFKLLAVSATQCVAGSTTNKNTCGTGIGLRLPEPGSLTLAGLAMGGMFVIRRRRNRDDKQA